MSATNYRRKGRKQFRTALPRTAAGEDTSLPLQRRLSSAWQPTPPGRIVRTSTLYGAIVTTGETFFVPRNRIANLLPDPTPGSISRSRIVGDEGSDPSPIAKSRQAVWPLGFDSRPGSIRRPFPIYYDPDLVVPAQRTYRLDKTLLQLRPFRGSARFSEGPQLDTVSFQVSLGNRVLTPVPPPYSLLFGRSRHVRVTIGEDNQPRFSRYLPSLQPLPLGSARWALTPRPEVGVPLSRRLLQTINWHLLLNSGRIGRSLAVQETPRLSAVLREDGSYLLREDGTLILREQDVANTDYFSPPGRRILWGEQPLPSGSVFRSRMFWDQYAVPMFRSLNPLQPLPFAGASFRTFGVPNDHVLIAARRHVFSSQRKPTGQVVRSSPFASTSDFGLLIPRIALLQTLNPFAHQFVPQPVSRSLAPWTDSLQINLTRKIQDSWTLQPVFARFRRARTQLSATQYVPASPGTAIYGYYPSEPPCNCD